MGLSTSLAAVQVRPNLSGFVLWLPRIPEHLAVNHIAHMAVHLHGWLSAQVSKSLASDMLLMAMAFTVSHRELLNGLVLGDPLGAAVMLHMTMAFIGPPPSPLLFLPRLLFPLPCLLFAILNARF